MISFKEGSVFAITGLNKRTDLNGLKCTIGKTNAEHSGRIPVSVFYDGDEKNVLVKKDNLCQCLESLIQNTRGSLPLLEMNTMHDVNEILWKYNCLMEQLEEAITHRNHGRFIIAEQLMTKLLSEAEELFGKKSVKIASILKSFGILKFQQKCWNEAEDLLLRADKLRPVECVDNAQGTQTLEYLFIVQLNGRLFKKASDTLTRLKEFKDYVRPQIDTNPDELRKTLQEAKTNPAQCVVCRKWSILSACSRCHLTVYCSRDCQKTHWKIHRQVCRSTIFLNNKNSNLKPPQSHQVDDSSLFEVIENDDSDNILTSSILCNAKATKSVTSSCPTEMDQTLLSALADAQQSYFFCMNEVTSSTLLESDGGKRRFMVTVGVFSCITIFVWSKSSCANSPGPCFGAHVSLSALLRGLRACRQAKINIDCALYPQLSKLRECFQEYTGDVVVTLVGGHRAMDICEGLKTMFPKEMDKWSFAWHIKTGCKAALDGMHFNKVIWNTDLLLRFEGKKIKNMIDEERVRQKNMNFMIVALDTINGQLMTHTKYKNIESLLTGAVLSRQ